MKYLVPEFTKLLELFYPGHAMMLNINWSSNYAMVALDARMLRNMWVWVDGERKVHGEVQSMSVFKAHEICDGNIGPDVLVEWVDKIKVDENFYFRFRVNEVPSCGLHLGKSKKDFRWKATGKRAMGYRIG